MSDVAARARITLATLLGAGVALGVAVALYALHVAPYRPRLVRLTLPLPAGAEHLHGFRIGFVTDTHVGPTFGAEHLELPTALLRDARPDLILFGGDYISESPRFAARAAERMAAMAALAPRGSYAVLGNHDASNIPEKLMAALEAVGITVLCNQAVGLHVRGGSLWIAGIDDALLRRPDPRATFDHIPPGSPTIVLWHEADFAGSVARYRPLIQLSGHSHGGQVRLPIIGPLATPKGGQRYVRGMYHVGGMPLYVSAGVGVYRPPARLFCPPEVTLITFAADAARVEDRATRAE